MGPPPPGNPCAASQVSETAAWLIALLRPLTPFAEAIVRRQAERAGVPLARVTPDDVATIGPMILGAAQMFVDPARLTLLRREIERNRTSCA